MQRSLSILASQPGTCCCKNTDWIGSGMWARWTMASYLKTSSMVGSPLAKDLLATPTWGISMLTEMTWEPWILILTVGRAYQQTATNGSKLQRQLKGGEVRSLSLADEKRARHFTFYSVLPFPWKVILLALIQWLIPYMHEDRHVCV